MAVRTHPLYATYNQMRSRCNNPNSVGYLNYGARGITVCDRWLNDFWAFVEDMGERPDGHTLDRIDNDGPYSPDNCRWATWDDQVLTRRSRTVLGTTPYIYQNGTRFIVQVNVRRDERSRITAKTIEQAEDIRAQLLAERQIYKNIGVYN